MYNHLMKTKRVSISTKEPAEEEVKDEPANNAAEPKKEVKEKMSKYDLALWKKIQEAWKNHDIDK